MGKTRKNSGRSQIGGGKDMTLLSTVLAQNEVSLGASGNFGQLQDFTLAGMISFGINALLIVAAIAFFFMLLVGGIRWILSGGDKANTESARGQVTAAIVGLVIVFSAWIILNFVLGIFGIDVTNFDFNTIGGVSVG